MNNKEIAGIFEEIGQMLEIKGENPFKSRAYFNAARTIETLAQPLRDWAARPGSERSGESAPRWLIK